MNKDPFDSLIEKLEDLEDTISRLEKINPKEAHKLRVLIEKELTEMSEELDEL